MFIIIIIVVLTVSICSVRTCSCCWHWRCDRVELSPVCSGEIHVDAQWTHCRLLYSEALHSKPCFLYSSIIATDTTPRSAVLVNLHFKPLRARLTGLKTTKSIESTLFLISWTLFILVNMHLLCSSTISRSLSTRRQSRPSCWMPWSAPFTESETFVFAVESPATPTSILLVRNTSFPACARH